MDLAATSAPLVRACVACLLHITGFTSIEPRLCFLEGLGLRSTITSSLVRVNDYTNASIYIDLSANTEYRSYKVFRAFGHIHLTRTRYVNIDLDPAIQSQHWWVWD